MKGPPLPTPADLTLDRALARAARGTDGLIFLDLQEQEQRLPWVEVQLRARRTAAALGSAGVHAGDRVAIVLPTGPDFVDALLGCVLAGAVPVPLYPPVRLGRLPEYIDAACGMINAVTARLILTDMRLRKVLGQVVARARPGLGLTTLGDLARRAVEVQDRATAPAPAALADDLALIQFSSGTTRDPQPVALTHRQLAMQCAALKMELRPQDGTIQRGVAWLPLYHDMGLIGSLLTAVTYPGTLVLIRPEHFLAKPALWLRAISHYRASISSAPAFAFPYSARRIDAADLQGCDLSCWRLAICGAEPISSRALERFTHRFAPLGFDPSALMPAYGLAEATLAVTCRQRGAGIAELGVDPQRLACGERVAPGPLALVSSGRPLPGIELQIRDSRGRALPDRHCGRIHVKGPTVMTGYFDRPQATSKVIQAGWLDTGDLGFVDRDELYVCGRSKDVIIVRGANRHPAEFEDCLQGVPGARPGRSVAVGYTPPGADAETLLLLVEASKTITADDRAELQHRIAETVRRQTGIQPHTVQVLEPGCLPRTSSGKLRRQESLRRYLDGTLAPPGRTDPVTLAGHLLRSTVGFARTKFGR